MGERVWIPWAAVGIAAILLGASFGSSLVATAGGAMVLVSIVLVAARAMRRDKYSLDELQRIHDQEEIREAMYSEIDQDAEILCPCCGEPYDRKFPICPRCKK